MNDTDFNPIQTSRSIEESYREYIATTIHFADSDLQAQLEEILRKPGFLAKGPFLQSAPPYKKCESVSELVEKGVLCRSMLTLGDGDPKSFDIERPLYTHQIRAITKAVSGRNYAVVTGTGSGKTECFLLPILNDILTEFEKKGPTPGVRAMILYPMNALANDQLKRLRLLLKNTPVTFGRYTGDTEWTPKEARKKWRDENPGQERLPNEIISREEIREDPPNILLTNYSMLEYLLLRPDDAPLFGSVFGSNWRHLAIDEAHIYTGALGTEIAYLIRRLKARIASETGEPPKLHCYATSATIGSQEDLPKVARFAEDLFGEPFEGEGDDMDVITSDIDATQNALDTHAWGSLPLPAWSELRHELKREEGVNPERIEALLWKSDVPADVIARMDGKPTLLGLGEVLLGESSTAKLVERCRTLLDLTDISCIETIGIEGLSGNIEGIETLTAMVEVLSTCQRSKDIPILSSRYHSFLRAPEGLFLNLRTRKLIPNRVIEQPDAEGHASPVYEVSVCRHCGQAYILGNAEDAENATTHWLNPRHKGTDADDEFIPRIYHRLLNDADEIDLGEEISWLCPACGALHSSEEGGPHRFEHEAIRRIPIAKNEMEGDQPDEYVARCNHCGYQSRVAIQPMRVSPEAAGSVVCYELLRDVPPFEEDQQKKEAPSRFARAKTTSKRKAGSIICFSDKRQDAAFFAPAMERTYGSITKRQIIRAAVDERGSDGGCTPNAASSWIASALKKYYPYVLEESRFDADDLACAWMLDELAAEDSRNSLDGLGVVRIEPTEFDEGLESADVLSVVEEDVSNLQNTGLTWLSAKDYVIFAKVCLDTLRERNAANVPMGVSRARSNFEKRGNSVILGGDESGDCKDVIQFAGSTKRTENKRSSFIRKYAKAIHDVDLSRNESQIILQYLFEFIMDYVRSLSERYIVDVEAGTRQFKLNCDLWRMYPHKKDDVIFRCNTCGCSTHIDTAGICTTRKCDGSMQKATFAELENVDRYYKELYQQEALPARIEEHTAQLSSKRARQIQSEFIKGNVNVLSCTTTFELGVDVGDLRAIFMRNVPPATANYTQRSGRVGRRAGMPGYAVTFARLRPHDLAYFQNPERIISGETRVPSCYLDNDSIALRHVFAVALSEYFRQSKGTDEHDSSRYYNDFMKLSDEQPKGLHELKDFLQSNPKKILDQLHVLIPEGSDINERLGIADWKWVELLLGEPDESKNKEGGRLLGTHALKHADYIRIQDGIDELRDSDPKKAGGLCYTLNELENEDTIAVLAENGILPKYGFPTDLVELYLIDQDQAADERLTLQRGMRQAIREYAPGAEIVAGKELWRSIGVRKPRGHVLTKRRYGTCPECETFVWPIDNYCTIGECPVCKTEFELTKLMLIPSYGFSGKSIRKGVGLRRPRSRGFTKIIFSQRSIAGAEVNEIIFPGGSIKKRYAGNGQLCALNAPHRGFQICEYCGSAATAGEEIHHQDWCGKRGIAPQIKHYDSLGSAFVSDVLELSFKFDTHTSFSFDDWESVSWALFTAASRLLEIPETEMGATWYENDSHGMSIMLYDDVPGGAGHARQLNDRVEELIHTAYEVVDGRCGCGGETCCYGCIANYYNQGRQASLSRDAAKSILEALLSVDEPAIRNNSAEFAAISASVASEKANARHSIDTIEPNAQIMPSYDESLQMDDEDFQEACSQAALYLSNEAADYISSLGSAGAQLDLEAPTFPVSFIDENGACAEASLVWKSARTVFLDKDACSDFLESFGEDYRERLGNYTVVTLEDGIDPDTFAAILKERSSWQR